MKNNLVIEGLNNYREPRNLNNQVFDKRVQMGNLLDEVKEYFDFEEVYHQIDALCDIQVLSINAMSQITDNLVIFDMIDDPLIDIYDCIAILSQMKRLEGEDCVVAFSHLILASSVAMVNLGYDHEKCMLETIKEISSRVQDPVQKVEWDAITSAGKKPVGKWLKDKGQSKNTLYVADYHACQLGGTRVHEASTKFKEQVKKNHTKGAE